MMDGFYFQKSNKLNKDEKKCMDTITKLYKLTITNLIK